MKLLIIGAGGHGRCCLDIARSMKKFDLISFLDNQYIGEIINDSKVIGSFDDFEKVFKDYDEFFIAVGNNRLRFELSQRIQNVKGTIATLISPLAIISPYAMIEDGCVIFPQAIIEANSIIKQQCIIAANVVVNHDVIINAFSLINTGSIVRPESIVGKFCKIDSLCYVPFGKKVPDDSEIIHKG